MLRMSQLRQKEVRLRCDNSQIIQFHKDALESIIAWNDVQKPNGQKLCILLEVTNQKLSNEMHIWIGTLKERPGDLEMTLFIIRFDTTSETFKVSNPKLPLPFTSITVEELDNILLATLLTIEI